MTPQSETSKQKSKIQKTQKPTILNRVSTQIYTGIAAAVLLTLTASVVGVISFQRIDNAQQNLQELGIKRLNQALEATGIAGRIVDSGTRMVTSPSRADYEGHVQDLDNARGEWDDLINTLYSAADDGDEVTLTDDEVTISAIDSYGKRLTENLDTISDRMPVYYMLDDSINGYYDDHSITGSGDPEYVEGVKDRIDEQRDNLSKSMDEEIDKQFFLVMTGFRDLDKQQESQARLSERELINYRHLRLLQLNLTSALELLDRSYVAAFAANDPDPAVVNPLKEQFEFVCDRMQISIKNIDRNDNIDSLIANLGVREEDGTVRDCDIAELLSKDSIAGLSSEEVSDHLSCQIQTDSWIRADSGQCDLFSLARDLFFLAGTRLEILASQQTLLEDNIVASTSLLTTVADYAETARLAAEVNAEASSSTIDTGKLLLLLISGLGVIAAILVGWLYIGRLLLTRIAKLSDRMRQLVDGDLETEVEIKGRDELADMASALEVFRRHALEVQRLNLLEKLTAELVDKNERLETANDKLAAANDQLEAALGELGKAQDQIVAREKLAALGEVTAGVAHEIRNPLNFIKNFSEVSEELLDELNEAIEDTAEIADKSDREYLDEIIGDLQQNMKRIISHSERANRIVGDMLRMGRNVSERQATDINALLSDHAKLAYHSARATDPDFTLELKEEFDPDMGLMSVTSQDLGRVFLNLVTNAGDATNEKYKALGGASNEDDYLPIVRMTTSRTPTDAVIKIWDNGNGIPQDVISKIFEPFFTTKPTDQGTGLGLSISHDIVQSHGGTLEASSSPGEFTEFVVTLPLSPPEEQPAAPAAEAVAAAADAVSAAAEGD